MRELIEDFVQHLRNERGQSENTQLAYFALLNRFVSWAGTQGLTDWRSVELSHLLAFLQHERERPLAAAPTQCSRTLSSESLYLEVAALRAFHRWAESEGLLARNVAESLSLPRRWNRLPNSLTDEEISKLLAPSAKETPAALCDQAILELAYASGLRISELRTIRLEQLQLQSGFISVIGKGNKERVVPLG